jgi:hypothetical protein
VSSPLLLGNTFQRKSYIFACWSDGGKGMQADESESICLCKTILEVILEENPLKNNYCVNCVLLPYSVSADLCVVLKQKGICLLKCLG